MEARGEGAGKGLREEHSRWNQDGQKLKGGNQLAIQGRSVAVSEQRGKNYSVSGGKLGSQRP